ncbi:MAG: hypothetical protein ACOYLB_01145 [Phototrophicaceae bacterium]
MYWYIYHSTFNLPVEVWVSRGSVGFVFEDNSQSYELNQRQLLDDKTQIITDSQSQVSAIFYAKDESSIIAEVISKKNATYTLRSATAPRFGWSNQNQQIILEDFNGKFEVFIPEESVETVLYIHIHPDLQITLDRPGTYLITSLNNELDLTVLDGHAFIKKNGERYIHSIVTGQRARRLTPDDQIMLTVSQENLLDKNIMDGNNVVEVPRNSENVILPNFGIWNCLDQSFNDPKGQFSITRHLQRSTLRLYRGSNTNSHGETFCFFPFGPSGQVGRTIQQYEFLGIRTRFRLEAQSLDLCGVVGSECPLMILLDYVDTEGRSNQWFHGFYANVRQDTSYPFICSSCQQEHEQVNINTWYTYESGNLFNLLPPDRKPASILNIRVYASGHDYDVYISDFALLGALSE